MSVTAKLVEFKPNSKNNAKSGAKVPIKFSVVNLSVPLQLQVRLIWHYKMPVGNDEAHLPSLRHECFSWFSFITSG